MKLNKITVLIVLLFTFSIHEVAAQTITYDPWQNLTLQENMPAPIELQHSNNNLDVMKFKGKYYVAFRTAPTHFASTKAMIYVISSTDLKKWDYEYTIFRKSDLREPRFVILKDSLYLYCFRGGTKMFKFEPQEILVTVTNGQSQQWTNPANIGLDGFVPWRLRNVNDTLFLSAYYGKELYNSKHHSDLRLLTSMDGRQFKPISEAPQINIKTAEEGEFIFDKRGDLYATVRLEGSGSLICRADKDSLAHWNFKRYKYKYDSALLFDHNDDIYLISRRNLDGAIDKSDYVEPEKIDTVKVISTDKNEDSKTTTAIDTSIKMKKIETRDVTVVDHKHHAKHPSSRTNNLIRYSITRKRTALFKFDKENLQVNQVLDFPSTGDCSYAALQQLDANNYLVLNYSSDIHKQEKNWIRGQLGKTYIYWTILHFNQ